MKSSKYLFIIMISILFLAYACPEKEVEPDSTITINNNSPDSLLCWIDFRNLNDTLLPVNSLFPNQDAYNLNLILPETSFIEKGPFIYASNHYHKSKIIMVFLFSLNDVKSRPWDTIRENYIIKRRYDLSITELQRMNWIINYP